MSKSVLFSPLAGIGEIVAGTNLGAVIAEHLARLQYVPRTGDVLVLAQKIVSKAESRFVDLVEVVPSARAQELASITRKDPRLVEVVLRESDAVVRAAPNVLIVRHRLGFVAANAGVDRSNLPQDPGKELALLLPVDPDASAARLLADLRERLDGPSGVIISDSFGRPWRNGVVNVALGVAGLPAVIDRRGEKDRHGRTLEVTEVAFADAIAAGAALASGEGAEGIPAVLVQGLSWQAPASNGQALIRPASMDLFR